MQNPFRCASSLILASSIEYVTPRKGRFRILMVKRRTAGGQNTFTFPSDDIDLKADFDPNWAVMRMPAVMNNPGFPYATVSDYLKNLESSTRLPAFWVNRQHQRTMPMPGSAGDVWMPAEHAFKIAALRALFTNCGFLLAKIGNGQKIFILPSQDVNRRLWKEDRQFVREDANSFFNVCEKRSLEPAYFVLKHWANWLSPCTHSVSNRVDTVFNFAMLNTNQTKYVGDTAWLDRDELMTHEWLLPSDLLIRLRDGQVKLSVADFYEIAHIEKSLYLLHVYGTAQRRQEYGLVSLFCPVVARTDNGTRVYLLPGDFEYPEHIDLSQCNVPEMRIPDLDIDVQKPKSPLHRIVMTSGDEDYRKTRIYKTYDEKRHIFDMETVSWRDFDTDHLCSFSIPPNVV